MEQVTGGKMNNLLQKTLKPLTIFSLVVFVLSIPTYFFMIDRIWLSELDENNKLIAQRIENQFNNQQITDEKLDESIRFWNDFQTVSKIKPIWKPLQKDSVYTIYRQNPFLEKKSIDRFRGLITSIEINDKNFTIVIETNIEEAEETLVYIALVSVLFFLILTIGFWILSKKLSKKLWKPFRYTLQKLKSFRLNNHTTIEFPRTDIIEFHQLNIALDKLLQNSVSVYKSQKEFVENASHELQTPLAIIKNKLDLFLQDKSLTSKQYNIIEQINRSLLRMSKINKNLLLLSKIENKQFKNIQIFNIYDIVKNLIVELEDFTKNKNIFINISVSENYSIQSDKYLAEILIYNLILNAIQHTEKNKTINIELKSDELIVSNPGDKELDENTIFERFRKSNLQSKGSGLGLAIVKEICNNNNWKINYTFQNKQHHFVLKFINSKFIQN